MLDHRHALLYPARKVFEKKKAFWQAVAWHGLFLPSVVVFWGLPTQCMITVDNEADVCAVIALSDTKQNT